MDPVSSHNMLIAALAAGVIIFAGAAYAMLFTFSRLWHKPVLMRWGYAAYGVLAAAVVLLAQVLNLYGYWLVLVALMLIGYLVLPQFIWHLCVATHEHSETDVQVRGQL